MTLYKQFMNFNKKHGLDTNDIFHQREDGYDFISFGETADNDNGLIYNVVFIFEDEDDIAELYIRKQIKIENRLEVFEKLNKFNSNYRGLSFFLLKNDTVCVKSYCVTGGDIHLALVMLARNMECAQELFSEFEPA